MAGKSSAIRGVASFPKRFVNQVRPRDPSPPLSSFCSGYSRNVHTSVYDKNVDEHVCPAVVPDDIVHQKSEYWAPNPHTGIFGPVAKATPSSAANAAGGSESVLDQKAFFRGMENLDKPHNP